MKTIVSKLGFLALTAGLLLVMGLTGICQPTPENAPDRRRPGPRAPLDPGMPGEPRPPAMAGRFGPGLMQAFAVLTPEQRDSLRQQLARDRQNAGGSEQKIIDARRELVEAALSGKFDEKAVRKHAKRIANFETDRMVAMAKALAKVEPPLTTEQKERLLNPPPPQQQFNQERRQFRRDGQPQRDRQNRDRNTPRQPARKDTQ